MILTSPCPSCGRRERTREGLCPLCVLRQALGETEETPTAGSETSPGGVVPEWVNGILTSPQQPDEIGRLGPYRILSVLGQGGMGVVFRAEDPELRRLVALKAMLPELVEHQDHRSRFLREARAAAAVRDDHVVHIYQVGEDRGLPFVAMEYLEGEPLDARMRRSPRLSIGEILRIGRDTALGLAAAHERGLVHRDIKPGNLWLEARTGRVKVLDFGLARGEGDDVQVTRTGNIVGTPAYMAPEQARGLDPDPRGDLFSLGCVLYRLLTGIVPFQGRDTASVVMSLALDTPRAPVEIDSIVPGELSDFVLKLLEKDAEKRPASAREVAAAFERMAARWAPVPAAEHAVPKAADVEPRTVPHGTGPCASAGPPLRRRRGWMWVGLGVPALAAVLLGIVLYLPTPDGVLRVEVLDPKIAVALGDGKLLVHGAGEKEITLSPGKNKLRVTRDGFSFETKEFALLRGETTRLRVEWLDGKVVVQKDGAPFDASGWPAKDEPKTGKALPKPPQVDPPKVATRPPADPDRAVAEWVLEHKGQVNDQRQEYRKVADLPRTPFRVVLIDLHARAGVTDADLVLLGKAVHVHHLDLTCTPVTDAGLVHLQGMRKLEFLSLGGTEITDAGLPLLKGFGELRRLFLAGTRVTDAGLAHLVGLKLLVLGLNGAKEITDAGVVHIVRMPTVDRIDLTDTQVTDRALDLLVKMKSLKHLILARTAISGEAIVAFRRARPEVEVFWTALDGRTDPNPRAALAPFEEKSGKAYQEAWARHLGVPVEKDVPLPGGARMTFLLIPPGEFLMGSTEEEVARFRKAAGDNKGIADIVLREQPRHRVRLSRPFYLGKYEVTQDQWEKTMGRNPATLYRDPQQPVGNISWDDIQPFLVKLNQEAARKGMRFALPTEAQWEFACRAGSAHAWPFGDDEAQLKEHAWYEANTVDPGGPRRVGLLRPNAFGLHDMLGNVSEWVADRFSDRYGTGWLALRTDPTGPTTGDIRMVRGDSHHSTSASVRPAWRFSFVPGYRYPGLGCRLALIFDPPK